MKLTYLKIKLNNQGFTLVETLMVISLFTVVMLIISQFSYNFYRQNEYALEQSAAIQNGRRGVATLVGDLREAVPSQGGAYPIETAEANSITFFSDIDRDEFVERAYYYVNNQAQLIKEVTEPVGSPATYSASPTSTEIVAEYIINDLFEKDIFTYFDDSGSEIDNLNDADAVRFVEVNLIVNVDPARQPEEFVLRSSAYLRNLQPTLQ